MTTRRLVSRACKASGLVLILAAFGNTAQAGAGPPPPNYNNKQSVPEIDPGSALSAFTLLTGGLMVLTDRRRAK